MIRLEWMGTATVPVKFALAGGDPYLGKIDLRGRSGERYLEWKAGETVDGVLILENLTAGSKVHLEPRLPGWIVEPGRVEATPGPGLNPPITFILFSPAMISGRVVHADGGPAPEAMVACNELGDLDWISSAQEWRARVRSKVAFTGGDGRFLLECSHASEVTLVAVWEGEKGLFAGTGNPVVALPGKTVDAGDINLRDLARDRDENATCSITGIVRSGRDGPLFRSTTLRYRIENRDSRRNVSIRDAHLALDAEGRYTLRYLLPGTVSLTVAADGHRMGKKEGIVLEPGGSTRVGFELEPFGHSLRGRIETDPPGEAGGSSVFCNPYRYVDYPVADSARRRVCAGPDGSFLLQTLPPGKYTVLIDGPASFLPVLLNVVWGMEGDMKTEKRGFEPDSFLNAGEFEPDKILKPGEKLRVVLERGGTVFGTVLYEDGSPAEGRSVSATPTRGWLTVKNRDLREVLEKRSSAICDREGRFRIEGLPEGRYRVYASRKKRETVSVLRGGTAGPLVLRLGERPPARVKRDTVRVRLRVLFPDGTPAPGSALWEVAPGECWGYMGAAGPLGALDLGDDVVGALYCACASRLGYAPSAPVRFKVEKDGQIVDFRLRKGATVSGRLFLPTGIQTEIIEVGVNFYGQEIEVPWEYLRNSTSGNQPFFSSTVNKDGGFRITGLPPGLFQVFPYVPVTSHGDHLDGFQNGRDMAARMRKFVSLQEGSSAVLDFDLCNFGMFKATAHLETARGESTGEHFTFWSEGEYKTPYPPVLPGGFVSSGLSAEEKASPGVYTAGFAFQKNSGCLWLLREGVKVKAGATTEISIVHDPAHCGAVKAQFEDPGGSSFRTGAFLFLWKPETRVFACRTSEKGDVAFDEIPEGTYKCRVVRGWWEELLDLGEVRIVAGKVTNLGTIRVGD